MGAARGTSEDLRTHVTFAGGALKLPVSSEKNANVPAFLVSVFEHGFTCAGKATAYAVYSNNPLNDQTVISNPRASHVTATQEVETKKKRVLHVS